MRRSTLLLVALAAIVSVTAPAIAAPRAAAPEMNVQLWPANPEGPALIVHAVVPTSTPLPYTLRLPLPKGAQITWAGEITGRGVDTDVERTPKLVAGSGGQVAEITLSRQREGQYEAALVPVTLEGPVSVSTLDWVQSAPADTVQFGAGFPANADQITVTPAQEGAPQHNDQGESLYLLPLRKLPLGQKLTLTARYSLTASGTTTAQAASGVAPGGAGSTTVIVVVGVLLALAVIVLVGVVAMQRRRSTGEPPE